MNDAWFSRRALIGLIGLVLITVAFILCVLKSVGFEIFKQFVEAVLYLIAMIIGGLTATDILDKWKNGK